MSKQSIAYAFSRAVSTYDDAANIQFESAKYLISKIPDKTYQHAIDLGCGTGKVSKHLLQAKKIQSLSLLDTSEAMLNHASELNHIDNEHRFLSTIESFQAKQRYDLIFSNFALQWVENIGHVLPQICQHLSPNGKLALAFPIQPSLNELKTCAKHHNISLALNTLPSLEKLELILKQLSATHKIYWEIKTYEEKIHCLFEGIKKIKAMGATHKKTLNTMLSPTKIKHSKSTEATTLNWTVIYIYTLRKAKTNEPSITMLNNLSYPSVFPNPR